MAKYSIEKSTLTGIADAVRAKEGTTAPIPVTDMATRIQAIQTGVELPALDSPGSSEDLMQGKQLIDSEGKPVTGTFTIEQELEEQADLVTQIQEALNTKTAVAIAPKIEVSEGGIVTAKSGVKTVSHQLSVSDDPDFVPENIVSGATIFGVTGNASGGEAPTISVNGSTGVITATSGDKSTTYTLSTDDDRDFIAENIRAQHNIFGIVGTLASPVNGLGSDMACGTAFPEEDTIVAYDIPFRPTAICLINDSIAANTLIFYTTMFMNSDSWGVYSNASAQMFELTRSGSITEVADNQYNFTLPLTDALGNSLGLTNQSFYRWIAIKDMN